MPVTARKPRYFPSPAVMPSEINEWLKKFEECLKKGIPEESYSHLVQMEAEDPEGCSCEKSFSACASLDWVHSNHKAYNKILWDIIRRQPLNTLAGLRVAAQHDLTTKSRKLPGYGEIALKTYTQALLDNFLQIRPNPRWV